MAATVVYVLWNQYYVDAFSNERSYVKCKSIVWTTALAVIEYMEKHNLPEKTAEKERVFNKRLTESSATIDNHC